MRRPPTEWILVLCRACEARLPLRRERVPRRIRCPLCGILSGVLKLGRPRRARAYSRA